MKYALYALFRPLMGLTSFTLDLLLVILSFVLGILEAASLGLAKASFSLERFLARKDKEHGR